jgi:hypothetical protein
MVTQRNFGTNGRLLTHGIGHSGQGGENRIRDSWSGDGQRYYGWYTLTSHLAAFPGLDMMVIADAYAIFVTGEILYTRIRGLGPCGRIWVELTDKLASCTNQSNLSAHPAPKFVLDCGRSEP